MLRPDLKDARQQLPVTSRKGGCNGGNRLTAVHLQVPLLPEPVHHTDNCLQNPGVDESLRWSLRQTLRRAKHRAQFKQNPIIAAFLLQSENQNDHFVNTAVARKNPNEVVYRFIVGVIRSTPTVHCVKNSDRVGG